MQSSRAAADEGVTRSLYPFVEESTRSWSKGTGQCQLGFGGQQAFSGGRSFGPGGGGKHWATGEPGEGRRVGPCPSSGHSACPLISEAGRRCRCWGGSLSLGRRAGAAAIGHRAFSRWVFNALCPWPMVSLCRRRELPRSLPLPPAVPFAHLEATKVPRSQLRPSGLGPGGPRRPRNLPVFRARPLVPDRPSHRPSPSFPSNVAHWRYTPSPNHPRDSIAGIFRRWQFNSKRLCTLSTLSMQDRTHR
jgi:hypothetical protein